VICDDRRVHTLMLTTSDGHSLAADLAAADDPLGAVVLCHPHPLFGGNRFNPVVDGLYRALPKAGFTALRFDFRAEHDKGVGEQLDIVAALDALDAPNPVPLFVAGYSFGALVALSTDDNRIAGIVAVAPPLSNDHPAPSARGLVITPRHDQYCPPETAALVTSAWNDVELDVIEGADHFLNGYSIAVAERATGWLLSRIAARSGNGAD
jgi:alpha/beta superfamily hydrolase